MSSGTAPTTSVSLKNGTVKSVSFPKNEEADYVQLLNGLKDKLKNDYNTKLSFSGLVQRIIKEHKISQKEDGSVFLTVKIKAAE